MNIDNINKAYFKDYPFSYGGKYRLYSYPKHIVDEAMLKGCQIIMFIVILRNKETL